ncbi:MAG: gamma-glutamyl-gamma-aminobutyrate hydrolase family protein [Candidatus Lindowbacteria bacterium]|nr:gamma-glutamyl-gamma-aminobutyrate hydrolase family protein [Candidatus Lindowbacteria bacterium]
MTKNLWLKRTLFVIVALALIYICIKIVYRARLEYEVPEDAPNIALTVDDSWLSVFGVSSAAYENAIIRAGGRPVKISTEMMDCLDCTAETAAAFLDANDIQGVLLSGGGDVDPRLYGLETTNVERVMRSRDDFELALIKEAERRHLPILGICRGAQILNVSRGGTLKNIRDNSLLKSIHFNVAGHSVQVDTGSYLAELVGTSNIQKVQSYHGQAVDTPGRGVRVLAHSSEGVKEAIEFTPESFNDSTGWVLAVQWHPELALTDDNQLNIFRELVKRSKVVKRAK